MKVNITETKASVKCSVNSSSNVHVFKVHVKNTYVNHLRNYEMLSLSDSFTRN